MNSIIKSTALTALGAIRPIGAPSTVARRSAEEEAAERLQRRIAELEQDLACRDQTLTALRADVERAFERGSAEGRDAGLAEAEDRQAERLALLEKALDKAEGHLRDGLAAMDCLAVLMARECLDVMLGEPEWRSELVCKLIRKQIAEVDKGALLRVAVSGEDFPDESALAALAERIGLAASAIVRGEDCAAGDCTMVLQLGRMEIGLGQQWGTLREALSGLAAQGDRP